MERQPLLNEQQQQEDDSSSQYSPDLSTSLIRYLYIGHFLARWDARFSLCFLYIKFIYLHFFFFFPSYFVFNSIHAHTYICLCINLQISQFFCYVCIEIFPFFIFQISVNL